MSTTYFEHWYGLFYNIHDLYTTNLAAGWCTWVTRPELGVGPEGVSHSYYVSVDDYWVVTESNENDNVARMSVP